MISIYSFKELGSHNYGWLDAHYHFSFANYYDPERCGFPPLIVWNDDTIQSGTGFPMHSHRDMEIITYVRKGVISHKDSLGNKGKTRTGEIQIMSAGTGLRIRNIILKMKKHYFSKFGFSPIKITLNQDGEILTSIWKQKVEYIPWHLEKKNSNTLRCLKFIKTQPCMS